MADLPVIMLATRDPARQAALAAALPQVDLRTVTAAEALLRETRTVIPAVVLVYLDLPSQIPLAELLELLRARPELADTYWVAVGSQGLGPMLQAGADALMSDTTPGEAMAQLVRTHLRRAQASRSQSERLGQAQRRLESWEHEERVRDQLVHMLVHDLKNPIAAVLGLLEVVDDDERVPGDLHELLHLAREETQHLLHLSVNMLDVRKIQAGKMRLNTELVFGPLLREIIEQAKGDVGAGLRERHLRVDLLESPTPFPADPEILRRVLANLLSNAMKHTTTGGVITVLTAEQNGQLEITIRDDGEGIPAEDIPNLFAAFEQSRLTLHGRFDTGMGLAFCKLAIEGHGGQIRVESVRGQGATFIFTLPLAQDLDDDDFAELI